jgi:hypothetical protein
MPLHKVDPGDMKPCRHMENLVSNRVDDKLTGAAKIYTDWHVSQCSKCQAGMQNLIVLKKRLSDLGPAGDQSGQSGLPAEQWSSVEAEWQKADASRE